MWQTQAQRFTIPDSLKGKSYEELYQNVYEAKNDSTLTLIYINTYLEKGKQDKDNVEIAYAYGLLSHYQEEDKVKLQYLDSAIMIGKNADHYSFPSLPYSLKAGYYYHKLNYGKALENLLFSLKAAEKKKNEAHIKMAKRNIAEIKSKLGKYEEAMELHRKVLLKDSRVGLEGEVDTINYLYHVLRVAEVHSKMGEIDSSSFYIRRGIKISKLVKGYDLYHNFVLKEGVNHYYRNNYPLAIDSIKKTLPFLSKYIDKDYILNAYLYLAKAHSKLVNREEAKKYYQKVDSMGLVEENMSLNLREAYSGLANYYKDKGDLKNQLVYVNKLLKFDSIYQENYKLMDKKLLEEYEIPNAIAQKEEIIATLEAERSTSATQITVISMLLALSLGGVVYYYRNQRVYKKRFVQLVNTTQQKTVTPSVKENTVKNKTGSTAISDETRNQLLAQLQKFEETQGYLKPKINAKDLAKSFGSNSSYLSIVVNTYKQKSLSQYLNDLRIDYVVERLQSDTKFRKYTIKAIAQEIGFNTAEAFAKAFCKKTGIYPSYFIKKLEGRK
ncbi:helix-turn-helix transcriptional regulator [Aquimarina gracilis]